MRKESHKNSTIKVTQAKPSGSGGRRHTSKDEKGCVALATGDLRKNELYQASAGQKHLRRGREGAVCTVDHSLERQRSGVPRR